MDAHTKKTRRLGRRTAGELQGFLFSQEEDKGGPALVQAGHFLSFREKHMQLPSFQNCGF